MLTRSKIEIAMNRGKINRIDAFHYILPICLILVSSCGSISIKSNPPDAEIKAKINGMPDVPIGTTKTFDLKQLESKNIQAPYVLEISKEGYAPQLIYITSKIAKDIQLNVTLKQLYNNTDINTLITETLSAEEELNKDNYKEALKIAQKLMSQFPEIAIPHTLAGIAHLKLGQLNESKRYLEEAIRLDGKQSKIKQLLAKVTETIEKKQNPK